MNFHSLIKAGLSCLPVKLDKKPTIAWDYLKKRLPTAEEALQWGNAPGMGIVCGEVSGNLTCLDFDTKYDPQKTIVQEFKELLKEWGVEYLLSRFVVESTPSGGYHFLFRSPINKPGEKIARHVKGGEAIIETRGEGHYFVCAPTPGWELKQGKLEDIPTFTREEAEIIFSACWALDRVEIPEPEPIHIPKDSKNKKDYSDWVSTFDDYNDRMDSKDVEIMLFENGWRKTGRKGLNDHYCRPGKNGRDTSATLHEVKKTFYVFSSNAEFTANKAYMPSAVYAIIHHGGDFKAASAALKGQGYGYKKPVSSSSNTVIQGSTISLEPLLVDMDSLDAEMEFAFDNKDDTGLGLEWKGLEYRVADHQLTIVTGYPSHGKSSVMASMAVHLAKANDWRFVVCSVEDYPNNKLGKKLIRKYTRKPIYALGKPEYMAAWKWVKEHFTFVNAAREDISLTGILDEAEKRNKEKRFNGLILDPWSEIDTGRPESTTETDFIKEALKKCRQFARRNRIAVWILAHPSKPKKDKDGNYLPVDLYDISGSQHWRAKADNGFIVSRDFKTNITKIEIHKIKFSDYGKIMSSVELVFDVPSETYREANIMDGMNDYKSKQGNEKPEKEMAW